MLSTKKINSLYKSRNNGSIILLYLIGWYFSVCKIMDTVWEAHFCKFVVVLKEILKLQWENNTLLVKLRGESRGGEQGVHTHTHTPASRDHLQLSKSSSILQMKKAQNEVEVISQCCISSWEKSWIRVGHFTFVRVVRFPWTLFHF